MLRLQQAAMTVMALAVTVTFCLGGWILWQNRTVQLQPLIDTLQAASQHTDDNLNRPCTVKGKPCGTLAGIDKAVVKVGDTVVTTQLAEQKTTQDTHRTLTALSGALDAVPVTLSHVQGTADASTALLFSAKKSVDDLPPLFGEVGFAVKDVDSAVKSSNLLLQDTDAVVKRPGLGQMIDGLGTTSTNLGLISHDLHVWSSPILNPQPCTTSKCRWSRAFDKLTALTGLGANAGRASTLFTPARVTIVH